MNPSIPSTISKRPTGIITATHKKSKSGLGLWNRNQMFVYLRRKMRLLTVFRDSFLKSYGFFEKWRAYCVPKFKCSLYTICIPSDSMRHSCFEKSKKYHRYESSIYLRNSLIVRALTHRVRFVIITITYFCVYSYSYSYPYVCAWCVRCASAELRLRGTYVYLRYV